MALVPKNANDIVDAGIVVNALGANPMAMPMTAAESNMNFIAEDFISYVSRARLEVVTYYISSHSPLRMPTEENYSATS
jgi:hypothetical protein